MQGFAEKPFLLQDLLWDVSAEYCRNVLFTLDREYDMVDLTGIHII